MVCGLWFVVCGLWFVACGLSFWFTDRTHLGGDRDGGVDRVGDHVDDGAGAVLGDGAGEPGHDTGVDLEEVIAGHAGLARNPCWDDHNVAPLEFTI